MILCRMQRLLAMSLNKLPRTTAKRKVVCKGTNHGFRITSSIQMQRSFVHQETEAFRAELDRYDEKLTSAKQQNWRRSNIKLTLPAEF